MASERTIWSRQPQLDAPVLVVGFSGWNDAGDAATWAVRHLHTRLDAEPFAGLDGEDFFDFTTTRPMVELDGDQRHLMWPANEFSAADDANLVLLQGIEPQLRWRSFCEEILDVAEAVEASMLVSLGALLAEVPHSRPVVVYGSCEDDDLGDRLGLERSSYEGPTGIVGVLNQMAQEAGLPTASLWAAVPNYVSGAASPKAALALVDRLQEVLAEPVVSTDLEIAASAYERQIAELVADDTDASEYIATLEAQYDDGELQQPDPEALVEQVEQFLRDQRD